MQKWITGALVIVGVVCAYLLAISPADAEEFKALTLREVSLTYRSYLPGGQNPLITSNGLSDRSLDKGIDVSMNMNLLKYGYWDNTIVALTDKDRNGSGQFRMVGWNYRFGIRLFNQLDLGLYHFSKHLLDAQLPYHFPVEDAIEIKIYLVRPDKPDTIF